MTSTLYGEYLLNQTLHRQSGMGVGKCDEGLLHCRKISKTLVHKRLKTGPEVLPTLTIFCHCPLHTLYATLTWRPTTTVDEMALGSFAAKI